MEKEDGWRLIKIPWVDHEKGPGSEGIKNEIAVRPCTLPWEIIVIDSTDTDSQTQAVQ